MVTEPGYGRVTVYRATCGLFVGETVPGARAVEPWYVQVRTELSKGKRRSCRIVKCVGAGNGCLRGNGAEADGTFEDDSVGAGTGHCADNALCRWAVIGKVSGVGVVILVQRRADGALEMVGADRELLGTCRESNAENCQSREAYERSYSGDSGERESCVLIEDVQG